MFLKCFFNSQTLQNINLWMINGKEFGQQSVKEYLQRFGNQFDIEKVIQWSKNNFFSNLNNFTIISIEKCLTACEFIGNKYQTNQIQNWAFNWHRGQKQIYHFVLLTFLFWRKTQPKSLVKNFTILQTPEEWIFISKLIFNKNPEFLKYQAYLLLCSQKKILWEQVDDSLIRSFIQYIDSQLRKHGAKNWLDISKNIFYESGKNKFLPPKQIRERWNNHLNKKIKKGEWKVRQDQLLLQSVVNCNRRWCEIKIILKERRTQHMIKNRFNFLVKKFREGFWHESQLVTQLLGKIKDKKGQNIQQAINQSKNSSEQKQKIKQKKGKRKEIAPQESQSSQQNSDVEVSQINSLDPKNSQGLLGNFSKFKQEEKSEQKEIQFLYDQNCMMYSFVDYPINWQYQRCTAMTPIWIIQQPFSGMRDSQQEQNDNLNTFLENWNSFH